ncbi:MAG: hypothetical protein V7K47_17495 [Nostoc sp.]
MSDARTLQNLDERTLALHEVRRRTRPPEAIANLLLLTILWKSEFFTLILINISCIFNNKLLLAVVS